MSWPKPPLEIVGLHIIEHDAEGQRDAVVDELFDFLGAVRLASNDTVWRPFYVEGLVFAAIIYFIMCYVMAAYARHLEYKRDTGHRS